LIDIIVPRNPGTCSRVKLLDAENVKPEKKLPSSTEAKDNQEPGRLVYKAAKIPAKRAVKTVKGFLPRLPTSLPATKLPKV